MQLSFVSSCSYLLFLPRSEQLLPDGRIADKEPINETLGMACGSSISLCS